MICTTTNHPTLCTCSCCCNDTMVWMPIAVESRKRERLSGRASEHWDAIRRSRAMTLADLPAPIVRRLDIAARDPLRHHKLRCMHRRPRLSLHERVT